MRTQKFEENRIDITLDEFDKLEENHEFSGRYNRKKEALLGAVRKRERNAGKLYYRVAVAAVLAMVLIPTTAFAATKLYNVNVENNGFEATIKVEKNTEISKKEAEKVYAPVKVEFTYLPKGSELDTNSGKYHVSTDEGEARCAHAVTPAELYKLDQDESKIFVPFTVNRWEYSTEDRKVIVFQKDDTFEFNKEVYVLFEDYGYIKKMYLGYGIEDEEVKKIAEGVKLTETTKENATTAYSMETLMQEQRMKGTYKTIEFAKQKNTWHEIGEEVEAYGGYHYKVTDVQVMDDLSQVDKKYFSDWGLEKLEKYADENGVFVPYERRKLIRGDGINTLNKYAEPEMMRKKLVYLTLEFTGEMEKRPALFIRFSF